MGQLSDTEAHGATATAAMEMLHEVESTSWPGPVSMIFDNVVKPTAASPRERFSRQAGPIAILKAVELN
jgi:hypothetical protein